MAEFDVLDEEAVATFFGSKNTTMNPDWQWLLSSGASIAMIFGGVLPYVPQYREIKRTENAEGFSTYVCLALLMANTLRILFWFGKRFELPLLIQSVVMIFAMLALIELCVRTKFSNNVVPQKTQTFIDLRINHFWQWTDFISYIEATAAFTVLMGILMYFFMDNAIFVESMGYCSLSTEAMLASPQLVKNLMSQSTSGLNKNMVLMWTAGDLFKTAYFVLNKVPFQFWLCGMTQVTIDLLILGQVALYKTARYKKVAKDEKETH